MSSSGYGIWWTLILHPFLARRQRYWESLLTLIIFKSLRVTEHKQKLTSSQLSHLKKKGPLGSIYQFGINTGLWVTGDRGWCQHHTASRWKPISDAWKLMHLNFAPVTFQGAPGLWVGKHLRTSSEAGGLCEAAWCLWIAQRALLFC